jgi:hypothetical protein
MCKVLNTAQAQSKCTMDSIYFIILLDIFMSLKKFMKDGKGAPHKIRELDKLKMLPVMT